MMKPAIAHSRRIRAIRTERELSRIKGDLENLRDYSIIEMVSACKKIDAMPRIEGLTEQIMFWACQSQRAASANDRGWMTRQILDDEFPRYDIEAARAVVAEMNDRLSAA